MRKKFLHPRSACAFNLRANYERRQGRGERKIIRLLIGLNYSSMMNVWPDELGGNNDHYQQRRIGEIAGAVAAANIKRDTAILQVPLIDKYGRFHHKFLCTKLITVS
jgi:hypothetical protein